jgi:hypothetical protein
MIISERKVRELLNECEGIEEVSASAIGECTLILDKFMYRLAEAIKDEFYIHNELRVFHSLPQIKKLSGEIVKDAGENLYLNLSDSVNKVTTDSIIGDTGQGNIDTVSSEANEVSYA